MQAGGRVAGSLALTVHGPAGVIDLVVPGEARFSDVAREYAAQCRLPAPPALRSTGGAALAPDDTLSRAGVRTGDLLVAEGAVRAAAVVPRREAPERAAGPGAGAAAWCCVATALSVLAGWFAARADGTHHDAAVAILAATAALALVPVGRHVTARLVVAPAVAGAAAYAVAWGPGPERLPTVLGVAALVAAVTAAVARALDRRAEEALRVWMVVGGAVFVVSAAGALLGTAPQVVWAVLLLAAMLAARFVPALAVDVPDQYLIDIERLAVTAWSARERPSGRRGRTLVPPEAVAAVAERGTRLVVAASAATWAVAAVSAPMLLATATLPVDRVGARAVVLLAGAALLLAARSYRHAVARALLRGAGLTCWAALLAVLLERVGAGRGTAAAIAIILLAALLVVVAVATGRGWRSAWWSRRAEVAEGLAGAFAIGAAVVAVGLFRTLWEIKFRV
ncbi:EsaB/YukD family protein [Nocardioides sp. SYSU D00038]|uniref:EsaB/YukD family protein n=1 Tax=Nocardioides sp. SYSU D00038 TaxID=2812554 RepID=UPI001967019E|nr:EsaB/YukD family protein [Nocardioides sp. SYSU D00038]